MRIGVFSVLYQNLPFEEALDKIAESGATAIEMGVVVIRGVTIVRWTICWKAKINVMNI